MQAARSYPKKHAVLCRAKKNWELVVIQVALWEIKVALKVSNVYVHSDNGDKLKYDRLC